ncbi:MAG TPA: energy-coupling factor ABC transporter ATP-binding protein [Bacillus sp. (in: firmicutes)]|uniref:energy-coupling factor ABC transporter ATP-binding protein n=1 Tax=Bacillus litorisediminis TaxID=2922713 RepID=UPI001FAC9A49|nr:energy-coupling factor ABC transporter ATP-binding protein [Bacillus litorisediminis]HWO78624.1 energy-coupling factor ABC transporter ATP-binding protein [Bacillus sp. (in: firmicutes)]
MKELVTVQNLFFQYNSQSAYALKNISLQVFEGEWLALVGHNGSGKSTFAKLLMGLQVFKEGQIIIDGLPLSEDTVWDIRKRIGMVFQNPDNQFVGATVEDDVAFTLENNGFPRDEMKQRVLYALRQVNMDEFLKVEPHHLSGGQKQRVAIAGVLALQPKLMILDEATSMLDPRGREEVLETVRQLKEKQDITVISITHDLEEAAKADRVIVLNQGEIYREGTPNEIFQLHEELVELGLDIPFSVKMRKALKEQGLPISQGSLSAGELVNELWTLFSKK